jgi:hypothetical protein
LKPPSSGSRPMNGCLANLLYLFEVLIAEVLIGISGP